MKAIYPEKETIFSLVDLILLNRLYVLLRNNMHTNIIITIIAIHQVVVRNTITFHILFVLIQKPKKSENIYSCCNCVGLS